MIDQHNTLSQVLDALDACFYSSSDETLALLDTRLDEYRANNATTASANLIWNVVADDINNKH